MDQTPSSRSCRVLATPEVLEVAGPWALDGSRAFVVQPCIK